MRNLLTLLFVLPVAVPAAAQWTEISFNEAMENIYIYEFGQSNATSNPIWVSGSKNVFYIREVTEDWYNDDMLGGYFPTSPNWNTGYQSLLIESDFETYTWSNLKLSPGEKVQIRIDLVRVMGSHHWTYSSSGLSGFATRYRYWETHGAHLIWAVPQ